MAIRLWQRSDIAITIVAESSGQPFFREDKFDGEIIRHLIRWLAPRDLCQLGAVDKQFRSFTRDTDLWASHYRRDFTHRAAREADNADTKEGYLEQHEDFEKGRAQIREATRKGKREQRKRQKRGRWNFVYHVFQESFIPCVLPPLVLLFTVFGILALNNGGRMSLSSASPLIIFIILISCATCLLCHVATGDTAFPCHHGAWNSDESPITKFYKWLDEDSVAGNLLGIVVFVMVMVSLLLVYLKVTAVISISWFRVALPAIGAIWLMLLCCGFLGFDTIIKDKAYNAIFKGSLCGAFVFIVLGALALDGSNIPIRIVLIPFFILDILGFAVCIVACWKSEIAEGCAVIWAYLLAFGAFTAFHVMLSLYFDASGHYGLTLMEVFIPLLITEGFVVLALWCGCIYWSTWDNQP